MFDFFDKLENKRAFKKALKEIQQEGNISKSTSNVSRVYSNETSNITSGGAGGFSPRYSDGLLKPDSEVVDMKNFKDWRKVERVESNHPVYKDKLFAGSLKNTTDKPTEKAEPVSERTMGNDEAKSVIDFLHDDDEAQDRKARNDFMSFMLKKSNEPEKKKEEPKPQEEKNQFKLLYEEIQRRKAAAAKNATEKVEPSNDVKKEEAKTEPVKQEPEKAKPEIVPVVGKEAEPKKPVKKVNRKPRGKNKRRFDADVIGSVDWR